MTLLPSSDIRQDGYAVTEAQRARAEGRTSRRYARRMGETMWAGVREAPAPFEPGAAVVCGTPGPQRSSVTSPT